MPEPTQRNSPFKPVWVLFAILIGFTLITLIGKNAFARDRIPWRIDVETAIEEGARAGKPVLLYFTATWCGPCQQLKGATWSDASVEAKLAGYIPVKVDIDREQTFSLSYEIGAVPTFVVLDETGKPAKRESGFMPADEFIRWIEKK